MNKTQRSFWLGAAAALVAGLILRLWFVHHMARIVGDSLVYGDIAKTWLQHRIYGLSSDAPSGARPTLIRLPGYPLFLAICFRLFGMEHYNAVLYAQVAIDLCSCYLASALAGRIFGPRARLPVLWIAALCPFLANYTSIVLAETLVFASIALAFYAFTCWQDAGLGYNRWLWIIAAALSYSILLRPEQGLLAAAVLPAMLWKSVTASPSCPPLRRALPVLACALATALPFIPWTARNAALFHVFQPLSPRNANDPGDVVLYGYGHWYSAWAIDFASTAEFCWPMDGDPIDFAKLPDRAFDASTPAASAELRSRTSTLFADYNDSLALTPEIDGRFDALAAILIHAHPVRSHVLLPIARVLDMTFRPRTETMAPVAYEWWQWSRHPAPTAFAIAYAALNLAYFAIAFTGFAVWNRRAWLSSNQHSYPELAAAMLASILLRWLLLLFIANSEPRYTLEFFPVFFVWIGAFFAPPAKDVAQV
jgi:hypothetical protein